VKRRVRARTRGKAAVTDWGRRRIKNEVACPWRRWSEARVQRPAYLLVDTPWSSARRRSALPRIFYIIWASLAPSVPTSAFRVRAPLGTRRVCRVDTAGSARACDSFALAKATCAVRVEGDTAVIPQGERQRQALRSRCVAVTGAPHRPDSARRYLWPMAALLGNFYSLLNAKTARTRTPSDSCPLSAIRAPPTTCLRQPSDHGISYIVYSLPAWAPEMRHLTESPLARLRHDTTEPEPLALRLATVECEQGLSRDTFLVASR